MDRKTARINGERTFSTGKPCKWGHTTYRYTISGSCSACINARVPAVTFRGHAADIATVVDVWNGLLALRSVADHARALAPTASDSDGGPSAWR